MELYLIIANIIGFIAWIFLVASYYKKNINQLLFMQIIAISLYIVNYALLGAYVALFIEIFELIKSYLYYKTNKYKLVFYVSLPIYILIIYFTVNSYISIIPILASLIDGIGISNSKNGATISGIVSHILWVVYDVYFMAYTCVATDIIVILSNVGVLLFGYNRLLQIKKFHLVKCTYLSKKLCNEINILDVEQYGKENIWDINYYRNLFKRNDDSLYIIKFKKELVGYINYLSISEDLYKDILDYGYLKKYEINDIVDFSTNKNNYILIDSICLKEKYQNETSDELIIDKIRYLIKLKYSQKYKIENIVSYAICEYEENILKKAKFKLIKIIDDNIKLYSLDEPSIKKYYL